MKRCACKRTCRKKVLGKGLFAKGHNPNSNAFKYTDSFRRKLAERNRSASMRRKVSIGLKRKYREDENFADYHRAILTARNKSERMREAQSGTARRQKISEATKASWKDPIVRKLRALGISKSWNNPASRDGRIAGILAAWNAKTAVEKARLIRNVIIAGQRKPNKPERLLNKILVGSFPGEFKLNVKGGVVLGGKTPDFVNVNGKKVVVEMFGEHWHKPSEEILRKKTFAKYGFSTLVIWQKELEDPEKVIKKVSSFLGGAK